MNTLHESWNPVVGFEGLYEVSDQGQVRSLDRSALTSNGQTRHYRGLLLRQKTDKAGRKIVTLSKEGATTQHKVHRLVMAAFVGPCPDGLMVCHFDGDSSNNFLSNLRYDTHRGNMDDALRHGTMGRPKATRCPRGHPYAGANLYLKPNGWQCCRKCRTEDSRRRYQLTKQAS